MKHILTISLLGIALIQAKAQTVKADIDALYNLVTTNGHGGAAGNQSYRVQYQGNKQQTLLIPTMLFDDDADSIAIGLNGERRILTGNADSLVRANWRTWHDEYDSVLHTLDRLIPLSVKHDKWEYHKNGADTVMYSMTFNPQGTERISFYHYNTRSAQTTIAPTAADINTPISHGCLEYTYMDDDGDRKEAVVSNDKPNNQGNNNDCYVMTNPAVTTLTPNDFHLLKQPFTIVAGKTNTILTFRHLCRTDEETIWVASEETVILDIRTGAQYVARRIIGSDARMCQDNIVRGMKDKVIEFQIEFPPLPRHTQHICFYGVPDIHSASKFEYRDKVFALNDIQAFHNITLGDSESTSLASLARRFRLGDVSVGWYSTERPPMPKPKLWKKAENYTGDDMDTYPRYTNTMLTPPHYIDRPYPTYAAWFTKDATYIACIEPCYWNGTYFSIPQWAEITTDDGTTLSLMSSGGYPIDTNFFVDVLAGNCAVFILTFPPVPLTTRELTIVGTSVATLSVADLLENQLLVKPFKPQVVR